MNSKLFLRKAYRSLGNRRLRVAAISALRALGGPYLNIALDTNNNCNLKCIMCPCSLPGPKPKPNIMALDDFEKIAKDIFPKTRVLDMSCGFEPFMTKNIVDYMRIARTHCSGQKTLCTNAILLNEEMIDKIIDEKLLDEITLSCDGFSPEVYSYIRKNGSFDTLTKNLQYLAYHNEKSEIAVRLNYTLLKSNLNDLKMAISFMDQYKIKTLQIRHVKLTNPFKHLYGESLFYHQKKYDEVIKDLTISFRKHKDKQLIAPPPFSTSHKQFSGKGQCAYPWFKFIITSNLDIYMCTIGRIGNLATSTFDQLMETEHVISIRKKLLAGYFEEFCADCHYVSDLGDIHKEETFIRDDLGINEIQGL
jgi:MoaA/NifB/PqqE/SkfB family radical SAM enzyme